MPASTAAQDSPRRPDTTLKAEMADAAAEGHALFSAGLVSLTLPPDLPRMSHMAIVVTVHDSPLRLAGVKRDGEDWCSCQSDPNSKSSSHTSSRTSLKSQSKARTKASNAGSHSRERDTPLRCAHLWALTYLLQAQRGRTMSALPQHMRPGPPSPGRSSGPAPRGGRAGGSGGGRSPSPDPFRPRSPSPQPSHLHLLDLEAGLPLSLHHRITKDLYGVGVVEPLARSRVFVATFRQTFGPGRREIDTLSVSVLAQLFNNVQAGMLGDYVNVLTALKVDGLFSGPTEPADLLARIITHCDDAASSSPSSSSPSWGPPSSPWVGGGMRGVGASSLGDLPRFTTEASVRCLDCGLLSFGRELYTHTRQSVYPSPTSTSAPTLDRLLALALFDVSQQRCQRCKTATLHMVKHTPFEFGRMLLVRVPHDCGSFYVPPAFRDRSLGYTWTLVGMMCWHEEGGRYTAIVSDDGAGGELMELEAGVPKRTVKCLNAPPSLIMYEREEV